jgi:hypothetical protein
MLALRIAMLCSLQVSALLLIFVAVNRSQEFYASWSDLFGQDTGGGTIAAVAVGHARAGRPVVVTASAPVALPGRGPGSGGRLESVLFHGQLSGLAVPGHVYLPPASRRAGGHYPVIVTIVGARADSPYQPLRLADSTAALISAGRMPPVILIMLPAGLGTDRGCLNVPGGPQLAMFFSQDLPAAVESAYHSSGHASSWGLLGDGSGGYCALQLAMTNSDTFSAAAVPPADYQAPPGTGETGRSPELRRQDDLRWLLRHQPMQPISVLFTGPGRQQPFRSLVHPPMRVASASLASGRSPLAPVLTWLGRELSAPRGGR